MTGNLDYRKSSRCCELYQFSLVIAIVEVEAEEQFGESVTNNNRGLIIELLRSS